MPARCPPVASTPVTFAGVWHAKPEWLTLSKAERLGILSGITARNTAHLARHAKIISFGLDQTSHAEQTTFFAVIDFTNRDAAQAYVEVLTSSRWFDLFDCAYAIGPHSTGFEVMTRHVAL